MSAYRFAEDTFLAMIAREDMAPAFSGGALLALSGGKDSVLLLSLFAAYAKENGIPFSAMHLHHGIRGEEADRDAEFCRTLCERMGTSFILLHADIPAISEACGEGIEETARRERYRLLARVAREHGYTAILTAHTASDNAETVLFQILRGGGTRALCGIPPKRLQGEGLTVLRPLLALSTDEVIAAVADAGLSYVTDSTNADSAYTRNYLRKEVLPLLSRVTPSPERAFTRMTENVREDAALLDGLAREHFEALYEDGGLCADGFFALPDALRFRVLRFLYDKVMPEAPLPTRTHVRAACVLAEKKSGSVSMPGGLSLMRSGERLCFGEDEPFEHPLTPIHMGCNLLADGGCLWLLDESSKPLPAIVYTLSTQRPLASATIEGELYVRSRKEGDAYRYGDATHKLKKLFSDRKIPTALRGAVPVLCDARGILWVPPFGVRDDGGERPRDLTLVYLAAKDIDADITDLLLNYKNDILTPGV